MSSLIESLAQTRHAERYTGSPAGAAPQRDASTNMHSTRSRAGWLLVGLGLRLALPGRQDAAQRVTLLGR